MTKKGWQWLAQCKRGHERTPENTYTRGDGRKSCRPCREIATQTWRAKNRQARLEWERQRGRRRRRDPMKRAALLRCERAATSKYKYGVSAERFAEMFNAQGGRCAICSIPQDQLRRKLCIDHNHATGAVRGLLCNACNTGIGHMKDSIDRLNSAIAYLSKHGGA